MSSQIDSIVTILIFYYCNLVHLVDRKWNMVVGEAASSDNHRVTTDTYTQSEKKNTTSTTLLNIFLIPIINKSVFKPLSHKGKDFLQ